MPHHITQRGNRRQQTFFCEDDYALYFDLICEWSAKHAVEIWAYCLMPNHVHLIATPQSEEGLRLALGETHRRYSRHINFRHDWRGHLWQGRYASYPMDERYFLAAARYVELNPVRARLATQPEDYRWSSAAAHLRGQDDKLVKVAPLLDIVGDWRPCLQLQPPPEEARSLRLHERTGRPLGGEGFVSKLERILSRSLRPHKAGRKPKSKGEK
jgi:putative transposase